MFWRHSWDIEMAVKDFRTQAWTDLYLLVTQVQVTRPAAPTTAFRFVHSYREVKAGPIPVVDVVDTAALQLQ